MSYKCLKGNKKKQVGIFYSVRRNRTQTFLEAFTCLFRNRRLCFTVRAAMNSTPIATVNSKLKEKSSLQSFQHSQFKKRPGSSSNGRASSTWLASPRWLPLAPDSVLESFSEYGGMTLNSSFAPSSCSSSWSLSSICGGEKEWLLQLTRAMKHGGNVKKSRST